MSDFKTQVKVGQRTYSIFEIAFACLILFYALLILYTFRDYGITSDETHHVKYGEQIVRWYVSGFKDEALFQTKNTWLYGGFFDITAYLTSQVLPLDRYDANHLCNAFFGLLGIVAAYRIGALLGGPFTGFLAALALFLTPRYYGHAFNNPKDIPFAVCYLWSVFYVIQCYQTFPKLARSTLIGTGLSIGFALGIRIGGLLLIAYLGLVIIFHLFQHRHTFIPTLKTILPRLGILFFIAYITMLLCWPYAFQNPISGPIIALQKFSQFTEFHTSFFGGQYVLNTALPRTYAPTWFLLTLPEFALVGILVGLYVSVTQRRIEHLLLFLTGLFPVLYAVVMNTPLYDGLRHLLFAIPPLVVFAMVGISGIIQNPKMQRIGIAIVALLFVSTGIEMVRLHPNQYVYFNTAIAGGVKQASGRYETDYWENTLKQGIRWIEKNMSPPPHQRIHIGGSSENIAYMIDPTKLNLITYAEKADVYLGTTRYDRHRKVPGEILHIITSSNTPLLYLIRPDTSYRHDPFFAESPFYHFRLGEIHEAEKRPAEALLAYQESLSKTLQQGNSASYFLMRIYIRIGNQYETLNQFHEALTTYLKALEYDSKNGALHNNIGIVFARLNDHKEAIRWLQKAVEIDPEYFTAWVNLGGISAQIEEYEQAGQAYRKALGLKDDTDIRYSLGKLEYELGNFDAAITEFQHILQQHPYDAQTLHNLALSYAELKNYDRAKEMVQRAIEQAPDDFKNYFTLGSIAMYQNAYTEAIEAYLKALEYNTQNSEVYVGLGLALASAGDVANARLAFQEALKIDPHHAEANHHLQTLLR
ncbi:MAG: tetratricopeptide repeat protein [Candidatus Latescibacterota bacterium]